jgi:hypothetical protein
VGVPLSLFSLLTVVAMVFFPPSYHHTRETNCSNLLQGRRAQTEGLSAESTPVHSKPPIIIFFPCQVSKSALVHVQFSCWPACLLALASSAMKQAAATRGTVANFSSYCISTVFATNAGARLTCALCASFGFPSELLTGQRAAFFR